MPDFSGKWINKNRVLLRQALLFLLVSLSFSSLRAQHTHIYFRHLTIEDGLSSNTINCILQDSVGLMWFGSNAGLERFDGYEFKTIQIEDSLNNSLKVFSILEDWDGARFFWLATNDGVKKYYPFSNTIVAQNLRSLKRIHSKYIKKDYTGMLWFDGANSVVCYNPKTGKEKKYNKALIKTDTVYVQRIYDIFEDSQRRLWFGSGIGLSIYDRSKDCLVKIHPNKRVSKRNTIKYSAFAEDANGNLWICSKEEGLTKYNPAAKTFTNYSRGVHSFRFGAQDLLIDATGYIWLISDAGEGLAKFNPQKETYEYFKYTNSSPNSITENFLNCIYQDRQGVIWIGTRKKGIERFSGNAAFFENMQNALIQDKNSFAGTIFTLFQESAEILWVSVKEHGLLKINPRTGAIRKYSNFPVSTKKKFSRITTIHKINNRFFVLGNMDYGLISFNPQSGAYKMLLNKIPQSKRSLSIFTGIKDKKGDLWFGLIMGGILRFNPQKRTYKYYATSADGKKHNRVLHLYENKKGEIFAGLNSSKVLKYNPKTDAFEHFYLFKGGHRVGIRDLYEDDQGRLWMVTNKMLFMLNTQTDSLFHFTYKQLFTDESLNCLLPDDMGNLWISYNSGLIRFNCETRRGENYSYKNGIASISFRQNLSFKSKDGTLFFGGKDGFTMFKPDSNLSSVPPAIMFTKSELYINNTESDKKGLFKQNFAGRKSLTLPYNNYSFLFEFALTDFIAPARSHFKYLLEGGSNHWQELGSRHSISFVSLPAGKYRLHIKGHDARGLWSRNELLAEFEILPPFWQTWWFWSWIILVLILIVLSGYQFRVFAIRRRNAELEAINKKLNNQINIRLQIERMLTENEIKYRTLVESIGDGIYTLNAAGVFHFINKTAAARIGGKPTDYIGHSIYEYYPGPVVKPLMKLVKLVIKDGESRELDAEIEIKGEKKNYNLGIYPLKNARGEISLTLHIAVDTSERVKLEAQLRQAQKMEAVGNLAGGIAHDFNNLLSVIRGYSFLLLSEENVEESVYKSIKEIDTAGERAQGLTRQLLAFSRKQMLKPKVMNLNTQIDGIKTMLNRLIPENIELIYDQSPELNHIFADPGQMEQVLLNLLLNARDAMPLGGRLIVKTENARIPEKLRSVFKEDKAGLFISLSVADNGIGMTQEVQQKVFDPFFTTKETGKGTGLGLSTVFGIVKQSGGYIWLESVYKEGSTFFIYLPAVNKNVIAEETENIELEYPRGHETILVVEDESSVRGMIVKMLSLYGYSTLEAKDGGDGLAVYEQNKDSIDLILSDVVMPGMSGVDLMKSVQEINPQQKILFMSGYTDEEIVQSGMIKRGIRFMQKPFSPDLLLRMLNELFSANTPA